MDEVALALANFLEATMRHAELPDMPEIVRVDRETDDLMLVVFGSGHVKYVRVLNNS